MSLRARLQALALAGMRKDPLGRSPVVPLNRLGAGRGRGSRGLFRKPPIRYVAALRKTDFCDGDGSGFPQKALRKTRALRKTLGGGRGSRRRRRW